MLPRLIAEADRHIVEHDVREFIVGHYGRFDYLAGQAVAAVKKRHPTVALTMLLPYHPIERPIEVPSCFDNTVYPWGMETIPRKFSIVRANRWAIEHSDYLIAYVWRPASNSRNLVEYAQKRAQNGKIQVTLLPR